MGYGKVNRYEDEEMGRDNFGISLVILQILLGIVSLATFSICIWIRFDLDFWEWCEEIGWYTYWNCVYVILVAMLLKAFTLALGSWSVLNEQRGLLVLCCVFHGIMMIFHLIGMVFICIYGVEESAYLTDELHEVFINLVYRWDDDPRASRILRIIQEYVGCCAAAGGSDFLDNLKEIPAECRHPITGNEWDNGCEQQLAFWLESWTATLAGVSAFLIVMDGIVIYLYVKFKKMLDAEQ